MTHSGKYSADSVRARPRGSAGLLIVRLGVLFALICVTATFVMILS